HSKGGLIGSYYIKRLGGDQRVKNLITLGTPYNGSTLAYVGCATFGLFARSVWQMTPRSPFIRKLKVGAVPQSVRLTSISSTGDRVSRPSACVLDTAGAGNLSNVELEGPSHRELLFKKSVYDVIHHELQVGLGAKVPARSHRATLRAVPESPPG